MTFVGFVSINMLLGFSFRFSPTGRVSHNLLMQTLDSVFNDALRILTGCRCPTPTDHQPILLCIQPVKLRRLGVTLSLAKSGTLYPDHILHGQLAGLPDMPRERLKSRRSFVPAVRKQLNDLSKLGIRTAQWTNYKWSVEYSKRTSVLHVFIHRASSWPLGMDLPRTPWVELNHLRTGVERFYVHVPMGSCFLAELRVWRHRSNRRPRYLNVSHTSGTSRGGWSDGFG